MTFSLFPAEPQPAESIADGAVLLRSWAAVNDGEWVAAVQEVLAQQPFQAAYTASGLPMSVRTSNCGEWGWAASRSGYGYTRSDPATGKPWPAMPAFLRHQARLLALQAGYADFEPDVCLINCYEVGAKMGLHHDADEKDKSAPIVSVSLGLPCTFVWGGLKRADPVRSFRLEHGDVLVWGGASHMVFHGVRPLQDGRHPVLGAQRWNLTFRMAQSRYSA
ncbi:DNA oxidative demethylase AlkB [Comamonas sp. NoAH]|uniref:DNA oxidative demethylase AlkB n=1 Tax=Comamonas halotolerans TaxID=3041496 RepID=UPI0024E0B921|nr:DNA oxidative demethylase AlkB [Comamonas sp. NoAH]